MTLLQFSSTVMSTSCLGLVLECICNLMNFQNFVIIVIDVQCVIKVFYLVL